MGDGCPSKPVAVDADEVDRLIESKCREYTDTIESEIAKYTQLLDREQRRNKELERQIEVLNHQPPVAVRPVHQNALAMPDWI
jgi:hypothetical protein